MLGAHLSTAKNISNALRTAEAMGLDTVQVFTKSQRQWAVKPLDPDIVAEWRSELNRLDWNGRIVAHDSYLINLASPDDGLWEKSIATMRIEFQRCHALGITHLVSHPGSPKDAGLEFGLNRIADAYARIYADILTGELEGDSVILCLENTAGGGTQIGRNFQELADLRSKIIDRVGDHAEKTVGVCIDSCHALAAGYDIAAHANGDGTGKKRTLAEGRQLGRAMLDDLFATLGPDAVRCLHLNDSIGARGSRIDRHTHIGQGNVAKGAITEMLIAPELANHNAGLGVPMIFETPAGEDDKGRDLDTLNMKILRKMADTA